MGLFYTPVRLVSPGRAIVRRILVAHFAILGLACSVPMLLAQDVATDKSAATTAKPISEEEANKFADKFCTAMLEGNIEAFNKLIDWDGITLKATEFPKSEKLAVTRKGYCAGITYQWKGVDGICTQIHDVIKDGGAYKCIRVNVKDQEPFVLFRMQLGETNGLNYHRVPLKRHSNGDLVASDLYMFASAEHLSESMHRTWLPLAQSKLRTPFEKFILPPDPHIANAASIGNFGKLVVSRKPVEALSQYRKLPVILQRDKNFLILRMRAAQAVSDEEYTQAINDFRKYHPDDLATDFLLMSGYSVRMKNVEAIECLDRINKTLGGDSILLVMRAKMLLQLMRVPEARKAVEDAILAEPELKDAYFMGIEVSLADREFDETVKYLTTLRTQFGQTFNDLREVEGFQEFVKSPQYLKWAEIQKK